LLVWTSAAAVGCSSSPAPAPPPASTNVSEAAPQAEAPPAEAPPADAPADLPFPRINAAWHGDLDGMIERRFIRVLTTHSKINYFVERGTQRGLVHDAFRMFEEQLNRDLKRKLDRVHVVFIPVAHDELIPALLAGRGDVVAAGTLLTDWRREQVDVTVPTRTNVSTIVVSGPGQPPLSSPQDLGGREVYLRMSDVSKRGVDTFNASLAAAGKPPVKLIAAPEVLADEDILEMINAGLVDTTIVDDYLAEFWQQVFPNLVVHKQVAVRTGQEVGMLVRKNSPKLLEALNAFLTRHPPGSYERNVLLREYLKSLKHVRNARSPEEVAKLERTVALFRKYGERYELDFLLMAAQAYQESRLDHNAKSPVGAIGVMQVMPATGKELAVGDITQLEPNVHAGVKYIRQLMDRNFGDEPMDDVNKMLFTFASYNAGPARIRQLRRRTAERGLDPNRWFNHVEVLVAQEIGRETVQYVSNIYKYYLAYKLISEQRDLQERARQKQGITP
jgi:membrane-bound lytic murein transglycosylase MltF